jgi:hypothetical protein
MELFSSRNPKQNMGKHGKDEKNEIKRACIQLYS